VDVTEHAGQVPHEEDEKAGEARPGTATRKCRAAEGRELVATRHELNVGPRGGYRARKARKTLTKVRAVDRV
jgi:hypothetical protein